MSNEAAEDLANVDVTNGEDEDGVAESFKAVKPSNSPASSSTPPWNSPAIKPADSGGHKYASDSGYVSMSGTPNGKEPGILLPRPTQVPFIQLMGLCISNMPMEANAKRRFLEVHLEIEKMLLDFIRKTRSGPGRYKPIAIRPMMLGKTEADSDAKSYMVVICPENIKRKIRDFFDEPLIKSLCEPGDDVPSFETLVVGHEPRLRASESDIRVQCRAMNSSYDSKKTFCGTPIRLCDASGHSRNATFGGIIKIESTYGLYELYGLTAGHMIREHQVAQLEEDTNLVTWIENDLANLSLNGGQMEAAKDQIPMTSQTMSNDIEQDDHENRHCSDEHELGRVFSANGLKALVDDQQSQRKPYLDWALFELNAHRPNQLAIHGRKNSRGDLHLPSSTKDAIKGEIFVSMLCASQGVKHGVLSTTRARVLLGPGDSFTDAYTLSLGSEISDGDSGSWVVDELRLEVYGHVVADDIFGDAYVIPMGDILADIRGCFGAKSVDLPSGLDIRSMATQAAEENPEYVPQLSDPDEEDSDEEHTDEEDFDGERKDSGYSSLKSTPIPSPSSRHRGPRRKKGPQTL